VLLNDLPNLHAGRVFSVVGDRTKAVSTGLDQVSQFGMKIMSITQLHDLISPASRIYSE